MAMTLEVVPQLMAMAQGGGEEKWNSAQVKSSTTHIAPNVLHTFQTEFRIFYIQDFAGDGWEAGWGGGYGGNFGRGGPGGRY